MTINNKVISLEKLAKEKLKKQILQDIDYIDVEVWEKVESGLSLKIGKKVFEFRLIIKTSTKKFAAWLAGLTATISGLITIFRWLIPILVEFISKPPP